ncbi:MAG: hypothetical protein RIS79_1202 [Verrucomicrobiota bacterium]
MITLTEILGRAEQGMTRPFVCRAAPLIYYVKGAYAGQRSLCCEWVANRLVRTVLQGLPLSVPPFAMAEVPVALIEGSARKDARELGAGLVFASLRIEGGQELSWSSARGWPGETMAALLLVDLWLQNEDRSLSALGGNPNLLVQQIPPLAEDDPEGALWKDQPRREMLWAYDFNLALDEDFNRERFFGSHVFAEALKAWPVGFREAMEPRLLAALSELDVIFEELPLEWLHVDGDESLPVQLDRDKVRSALELPFREPDLFWKLP